MGYSYDGAGWLCCDVCGTSGKVKRFRCPFGWCPAIALCAKCRKEHPEYVSKAEHRKRGCEASHLRFEAEKKEKTDLIAAGQFIRSAALYHPERPSPENVKVIFRGKDGNQAYWMSIATYHAISLDNNATPDDYRKVGTVLPARSLDLADKEIKPAPVRA